MISFEEICKRFPNIDGILLISESRLDPSRKTYLYNGKIIKSRKLDDDITAHLRQNNLKEEFEILNLCAGIECVPKALHNCENDNFELLFLNYLPGIQLVNLKISFIQMMKITFRLYKILIKLSQRGICHKDVTSHNILVTEEMLLSLIDFDQAVNTTPVKAFAGNFLGFKIGESEVSYSLIMIFKDYLKQKFPNLATKIKKLLSKGYKKELMKLPDIKEGADTNLLSLLEAWKLAQESNASSPGVFVAYYAIDFKGYHFPGERPWNERWNRLKNVSVYSGKTILELGCNMGLLSIHLLKEAGAAKCIGVDHDKKILESANLISEVFEVNPVFKQINFDSAKDWESDLLSYNIDVVFALNVLNWVYDKERLLKFLSNFPEIIFEGHDTTEVERKRFEQIGFNKIEEIGYSERERIILRCRK